VRGNPLFANGWLARTFKNNICRKKTQKRKKMKHSYLKTVEILNVKARFEKRKQLWFIKITFLLRDIL
jgi:hypothetical protein